MKGQFFLMIAIFLILILVLIRVSLNTTEIIETKKKLETGFERLQFQNVKDELQKAIQFNYYQRNVTDNINAFTRFAKTVLQTRALDLRGVYIETIYPTITANTDAFLNVTVFNLLGTKMDVVNVTFNTTQTLFNNVLDNQAVSANFTINTPSSRNTTLTVFYQTALENSTETFNITFEIGKSKFIGLFDLRLISDKAEFRDKFTKTIILP